VEDIVLSDLDRIRFQTDTSPSFIELDAQRGVAIQLRDPPRRLLKTARAITEDLVKRGGAGFRYVARSAMHKEVRRGDGAAAMRWARLLRLIDGESAVRQYARRILFEETRAVSLLGDWRTGDSAERRIRQLAAAAKLWTLPARQAVRCGPRRLLAYASALSAPPLTPDQIDRTLREPDLDALYRLLWRVQLAAEPAVVTALRDALSRRLPEDSPLSTLPGAASDPWLLEVMIESLLGIRSEGTHADEVAPVEDTVLTVPPLRDYVYDAHTRPGQVRLARSLAGIAPGIPMPSGVDLRWSGMARGVLWRELAMEQGGTAQPWEAVSIPEELWAAAHLLDGFYYERLYRDAGLHTPFPRRDWRGRE
jgi:hypothetical protein